MPTTIASIEERLQAQRQQARQRAFHALCSHLGETLAPGEWEIIPRHAIEQFARLIDYPGPATEDSDDNVDGAGEDNLLVPHHLILSQLPRLTRISQLPAAMGADAADLKPPVDCGYERVNFISDLQAGQRFRATQTLTMVTARETGVEAKLEIVVEADQSELPVCVAERVIRLDF